MRMQTAEMLELGHTRLGDGDPLRFPFAHYDGGAVAPLRRFGYRRAARLARGQDRSPNQSSSAFVTSWTFMSQIIAR